MKKSLGLLGLLLFISACGGDTTAPTVSLTTSAGANPVVFSGNLTLTANATDNVGVTKVEFFDGTTKLGEKTAAPYTQLVSLTSSQNATRNYTAKAFDAAGNSTVSSASTVNVNIAAGFVRMGTTLDVDVSKDSYVNGGYSLVRDSSGNPFVAWAETDGTSFNIYVKRWNGTAWVQMGSTFLDVNTDQRASGSSIALDSSGNPVVAWAETDGTSYNVYVKRWNGTAWVLVGNTFLDVNTNKDAAIPSIVVDPSGNPVVVWREFDDASTNVYVKRWNGTAWAQVGSTFLDVNTNKNAITPTLALNSSGNPIVAWAEGDGTSNNVYVKRWTGTAWEQLGSTFLDVNTDRTAFGPSMAIDLSGNPVVAWVDYDGTSNDVYVKRWTGTAWMQVGSTFLDANTNKNALYPSLVLDSSNNPLVVWYENDDIGNNIYMKRWTGSAWEQVGSTFLDVNTNQDAGSPSLAIDSSGDFVVVWGEGDGTSNNVYAKRFNR